MLLLIGSIICIFFNHGHGVVVVSPPDSPMYFSVGVPATISCTAQVPSGNAEDTVRLIQLANGTVLQDAISCFTSRSEPTVVVRFSPTFGNVTLSRSYAPSAVSCSFTLLIRDGTYRCISTDEENVQEKSFNVVTTKQPDGPYINNGSPEITANDGEIINVTCIAINSKPAYSMSWSHTDIVTAESTSSSQNAVNGYTNSTTSLIVVAAANMDGQVLTCRANSPIPNLGSPSATVVLRISYGPSDSVIDVQTSNGTFYCPLDSNPQITNYIWRLGNVTLAECTTQTCTLSQAQVQAHSQLTCEGQNPRTSRFAKATMNIVWRVVASSTVTAPVTGASNSGGQSSGLADGAIAGIVIGVVVFVALLIIVPVVVCMKRNRSKGASAGSDANTNRRSIPPASSGQSSRPYNFESTSGVGHKSPLSAQPDVVRNSGFSPSSLEPGQPHKAPSTPPPAYPGAMDMIDQKPRSRKPIALYDTALDDAYPNQTNASYLPSPKY